MFDYFNQYSCVLAHHLFLLYLAIMPTLGETVDQGDLPCPDQAVGTEVKVSQSDAHFLGTVLFWFGCEASPKGSCVEGSLPKAAMFLPGTLGK